MFSPQSLCIGCFLVWWAVPSHSGPSLSVMFLFYVACSLPISFYIITPLLCLHHTDIFGILLFGSLRLVSSTRITAPGRQGLLLYAPCYFGRPKQWLPHNRCLTIYRMLLNESWLLKPHRVWFMPGGGDAKGFVQAELESCSLELTNSFCWNCPPGQLDRLLGSAQNCPLKHLPLPWSPCSTRHPFFLVLGAPLSSL